MHVHIATVSQLVHSIRQRPYARTPSSTPRVHPLQPSSARSGRINQLRGFLVVAALSSHCSSYSIMPFSGASVPQTSSAPQDQQMYLPCSFPSLMYPPQLRPFLTLSAQAVAFDDFPPFSEFDSSFIAF